MPVVVAGVTVVLVGSWLFRGPAFIDRVTIVNDTAFDVNVDVAGSDGRVLGLEYVTAGETTVVRDVIDQGGTWEFRFSYGGTDAGTLLRNRSALERSNWTVEVPQEVEDRLETAGYTPPPPRGG
ncbi:MAG: hypothetical protein ACRDY6_05715 [Acidimicrobiia bacterium]